MYLGLGVELTQPAGKLSTAQSRSVLILYGNLTQCLCRCTFGNLVYHVDFQEPHAHFGQSSHSGVLIFL